MNKIKRYTKTEERILALNVYRGGVLDCSVVSLLVAVQSKVSVQWRRDWWDNKICPLLSLLLLDFVPCRLEFVLFVSFCVRFATESNNKTEVQFCSAANATFEHTYTHTHNASLTYNDYKHTITHTNIRVHHQSCKRSGHPVAEVEAA